MEGFTWSTPLSPTVSSQASFSHINLLGAHTTALSSRLLSFLRIITARFSIRLVDLISSNKAGHTSHYLCCIFSKQGLTCSTKTKQQAEGIKYHSYQGFSRKLYRSCWLSTPFLSIYLEHSFRLSCLCIHIYMSAFSYTLSLTRLHRLSWAGEAGIKALHGVLFSFFHYNFPPPFSLPVYLNLNVSWPAVAYHLFTGTTGRRRWTEVRKRAKKGTGKPRHRHSLSA